MMRWTSLLCMIVATWTGPMKRLVAKFFAAPLLAAMVGIPQVTSAAAATGATSWPMLGRNPQHTADSTDFTPNSSTAPTLGLNWMSNLHAADLGSPVVAFNTVLNKTVIYVGEENGDVFAFDESNGQQLWGVNLGLGDPFRATPAVGPNGSVWVASAYGATVTALSGATGKTLCSKRLIANIDASPMIATPPGGVLTVYTGTNDGNVKSGEEVALKASDCSQIFSVQTFRTSHAGTWVTTAFSPDATGTQGVALFGTADPDSTEYAIDAVTGQPLWDFKVQNPVGFYDVGEAATISAPGLNGNANGIVYISGKYAIMNALDLKTGAVLWQFDMYPPGYTGLRDARSSPALVGNTIVFGYLGGVYALNATTGALLWHYAAPFGLEVISSPAVVGAPGQEIVAFSDVAGKLHVLKLSDGTELYNYQTGGYVTASVAVANGHLITVSSDGFLYDFTAGGGNSAAPSTQVTFPAEGAQINNPNGTLTVTGSASDALGVAAVEVAVAYLGPIGVTWYNAATMTSNAASVDNPAVLSQRGATSTKWSFAFPAPASGGTFQVFANAVNVAHRSDVAGSHSTFSILPSVNSPQITLSNQYVSPGGTFSVTGAGFQSGEVVNFSVDGNVLAKPVANASGAVPSTQITLPGSGRFGNTSRFGPTTLVAVGQTSQRTTSAFLDVTNPWSQRAEGPTRTSFEGHDQKLHDLIHVAQGQFVKQAWHTPTGSPIGSSPAVVNGIAYVGNDAGVLSAIRVVTGAPAWTYTTVSGAAIHSSPAVDGSLVIFGSDDGKLYEVSKTTGALFGSLTIGGKLGSPAAASGTAYVASDTGTVAAILESHSGSPSLLWSVSVGAAIHSSVAFDNQSSGKPVIVGDDSGAITALDGTTGAILWTAKTGAAVTASPSILGGTVYVGSTDGNVYAFNEQTGVLVWKFLVGSPIQAGGIVGEIGVLPATPSVVYGTNGGTLIALSTAGARQWMVSLGQPIVGIAGAYDVVISEASNGTIFGNRGKDSGLNIWSFQTGAALSTAPAIVDGAVYVGSQDTGLYAFTPFGISPP